MKFQALDRFRRKLQADETVYGLWVTLEAAAVTDIASGLGLDWVVIDAERGYLDWAEIREHVRATVRSNTLSLIQLAEATPELIKRALDLGADGVAIPRVETAAQLQSIVTWLRQQEVAGNGGARGGRSGSPGYAQKSKMNALVVPVIETTGGERNIANLLDVEGVDLFFCDPADYATDIGLAGEPESPAVIAAYDGILHEIRNRSRHAGVVAMTEAKLASYQDRGFRMLGLGSDGEIIRRGISGILDLVREAPQSAVAFNPQAEEESKPPAKPKETRA